MKVDVLVIGGGIVGLSCAYTLLKKHPHINLALIEKESELAFHQTGHNSGVVHSGLYYKPKSLKARNCQRGRDLLFDFCEKYDVPFHKSGKIIAATDKSEFSRLEDLYLRGLANGVPGLRKVGSEEVLDFEPHCVALRGIYSPDTAVIDFSKVAKTLGRLIEEMGGEILLKQAFGRVLSREDPWLIETNNYEIEASFVVNCAGLHADRVARSLSNKSFPGKIVPFRGEYYRLKSERKDLVKALIYPVPDPSLPFLGLHFTRNIHAEVDLGPNAVLAWKREAYERRDRSLLDIFDIISYAGSWRLAWKHFRTGLHEAARSYSKRLFLRSLQRYVPEIDVDDIEESRSGVRAQFLLEDGSLCDDFVVEKAENALHVLSAPSPAATASFAIAEQLMEGVLSRHFSLA